MLVVSVRGAGRRPERAPEADLATACRADRPRPGEPAGGDPLRRRRRVPARLTIYAGLEGTQSTTANFAPIFIYVIFWLALVPLSVFFGDVFRAFNPWRAIGRAVAWVARTVSRDELPAPLEYPAWLGRWPAAVGISRFATMELVASNGDKPESLAIATLVYSALTFIAMALYGVERWMDRGEAFSVYFNLFSRISRSRRVTARWAAHAALRPATAGTAARDRRAGRGDDRLRLVRRLHRKAALEQHLAGHRPVLPGPRALTRARARADLPARADRGRPVRGGLLLAGSARGAQRGRRLQRPPPCAGVRALARPDRARVRGRALLHAAALPGPGDRTSRPTRWGRARHLRHRGQPDRLHPDRRTPPGTGRWASWSPGTWPR